MGEIPFEGNLKIGHNVKIGYFAQNQAQLLDGELTVFDTIDQVAVGDIRTRINDILGAFMFGGPASEKKVKVLSGGEKSRLAMIRLLLQPVNLLIMDEPTNHLDMRTKDILKDAIKDFNGTVIVVSHDRDFLDGLVEKVYEFGGGHVKEHLGGIYDFLAQKNMESLHELEKKEQLQQGIHAAKNVEQEVKQSKLNYQEQKELNKKIKQAEKRVSELEQHVNDLESQINHIEQQLAQGGEVDPDIYNRHSQLNAELEQTMTQWEDAGEELEKIKQ